MKYLDLLLFYVFIIGLWFVLQTEISARKVSKPLNFNKILSLVFGTTICKGTTVNDGDDIIEAATTCSDNPLLPAAVINTNITSEKYKKVKAKTRRKTDNKCLMICLWKQWGLTEQGVSSTALFSFVKKTFPESVNYGISQGMLNCTLDQDQTNRNNETEKYELNNCTRYLHVTRCFKKVVKMACI